VNKAENPETGVATLTSMILFGRLLLIGDGGTARSSEVETGSLLFDGLGLMATGFGGRKIVGMVTEQQETAAKPTHPE
jgi:hypothetical protein